MFHFVTLPDAALRRIFDILDKTDLENIWTAYKIELKRSYEVRNCPKMRQRYDRIMNRKRKREQKIFTVKKQKISNFSINNLVNF
jgi:hypothetical protein